MNDLDALAARLRRGGRRGITAFIATAGGAGSVIGVISAMGYLISPLGVTAAASASILAGLGSAYWNGTAHHLPLSVIRDVGEDESYEAAYCTAATLREADEWTKQYYGHEYVPPDVAESWRRKNAKGFVHIVNRKGDVCAAFGIIGIEHSFLLQFLKGRLADTQLESDDVLSFDKAKLAHSLYISGVVVREPESMRGHRRAVVMLWALGRYVKHHFGTRRRRDFYALAVTEPSARLLKRAGFDLICPGTVRADKADLYKLEIRPGELAKFVDRFGDQSSLCKCNF